MESITKIHRISVREIIDIILRSGDITSVSLSDKRMVDGTKAHQRFQKQQMEVGDYTSEVPIFYKFIREGMTFLVTGRIDGIIEQSSDLGRSIIVDEIKSTGGEIEHITQGHESHWAQVMMYAYMYCLQENIPSITCRLTYIELETFMIKQFERPITFGELESFFDRMMAAYSKFAKMIDTFENEMMLSCKDATFPFDSIRDGQSKLMKGVYRCILNKQILFSRAPTGIGKTIATLFPSIKAIGEAVSEKVFYLTAKTIGKEVAVKTIEQLVARGLNIKYVVITAKDKICIHTDTKCNPESCPYAKGHYDRINEGLKAMYQEVNGYTREVITKYAITHRLCPYELSLDLASFSQIIICDYNYAFDPSAMLRRFFVEGEGKYTLLVDEAHNLVDRSRKMYSAQIIKSQVLDLKKHVKELDSRLYAYFEKLNKVFIDKRGFMKESVCNEEVQNEPPLLMETYLRGIIYRTEKIFKLHKNWEHMDLLLDFYFQAYDFVKKFELYGDNYRTYYENSGQELIVKLLCIDPRMNLREILLNMQGVVYFSATLIPMNYYKHLLGGDDDSLGLNLESPFDPSKLKLLIDSSISTKYVDRQRSIEALSERINIFIRQRRGNYLVYFPSYKYLELGVDSFSKVKEDDCVEIMIQKRNLSEEEKEGFMNAFSHEDKKKTLVVFAVLGGMFGEGIDLVGDKLSGAIIVGVGLPLISFEQDIIRDYFKDTLGEGFDYAYTYPGMNKVLQAAGRVIRTTEDVGSVLLIDRRFNTAKYEQLFPNEWFQRERIRSIIELENALKQFWSERFEGID